MTYDCSAAHGCKIEIGDGATPGPEVFIEINGVFNGPNGPGWQPQIIEARHHGSKSIFRKVSNVVEQPVSFDVYFDSSDPGHQLLIDNAQEATKANVKMTLTDPGAQKYAFGAYISATFTGPVDGFNTYSIQLQVDGAIDIT